MALLWVTCGTTGVDHQIDADRALILTTTTDDLWWPCPDCGRGHVTKLSATQHAELVENDVAHVELEHLDLDAELREATP